MRPSSHLVSRGSTLIINNAPPLGVTPCLFARLRSRREQDGSTRSIQGRVSLFFLFILPAFARAVVRRPPQMTSVSRALRPFSPSPSVARAPVCVRRTCLAVLGPKYIPPVWCVFRPQSQSQCLPPLTPHQVRLTCRLVARSVALQPEAETLTHQPRPALRFQSSTAIRGWA